MQVRDLMNQSVVSITPAESASLAARLLSRHNLGSLPVCGEDGGLRGIVTDRDIVTRCVAAEEDPHKVQIKDIMSRNCAVVPVLEAGKVVGMVSLGDLAKCGACEMEAGEALSEISENIQRTRGLHQPERD